MTTWYVFETLTGKILDEFEPVSGSWSARLNEPETVDVIIDLLNPDDIRRDWRNLGTAWKHSIAVEESGVYFGGPIQPHDYDYDGGTLKLAARGIRSYFTKRNILPPAALTQPLVNSQGIPNAALDTVLTGFDLGSIGMRIVSQACQWPGAGLPITFHPARAGTRERTYVAVELKGVEDALKNLSEVINGPDFAFTLRRVSQSNMGWIFESGTEDAPRLISPSEFTWDISAEDAAGAGLSASTDPTRMVSLSWATGGKGSTADNSVLIARAYDPLLVDSGFPLLEEVDSSRSSVSVQSTLDGHAAEPLRTGRRPREFWSLKASLRGSPTLAEYRIGDFIRVAVTDSPYIPDGEYRRRIVEMSGDEMGDWVSLKCGEAYDG